MSDKLLKKSIDSEILALRNNEKLRKKYADLLKQAEAMAEALDHYTRHPVHWPKDENGIKLDEGPSRVAIKALARFEKFKGKNK